MLCLRSATYEHGGNRLRERRGPVVKASSVLNSALFPFLRLPSQACQLKHDRRRRQRNTSFTRSCTTLTAGELLVSNLQVESSDPVIDLFERVCLFGGCGITSLNVVRDAGIALERAIYQTDRRNLVLAGR